MASHILLERILTSGLRYFGRRPEVIPNRTRLTATRFKPIAGPPITLDPWKNMFTNVRQREGGPGGEIVTLASENSAVATVSTFTVSAGATAGTFPIITRPIHSVAPVPYFGNRRFGYPERRPQSVASGSRVTLVLTIDRNRTTRSRRHLAPSCDSGRK